jgi:hypothetical protein
MTSASVFKYVAKERGNKIIILFKNSISGLLEKYQSRS